MTDEKPFAPMYPVGLERDPRFADMESPVTVEHVLMNCPRCARQCWIGPTQASLVTFGGAEAICVYCLFTEEITGDEGEIRMISVNPEIDKAQRRFPKQ